MVPICFGNFPPKLPEKINFDQQFVLMLVPSPWPADYPTALCSKTTVVTYSMDYVM